MQWNITCLTVTEQNDLVKMYERHGSMQIDLAEAFCVSRRTVQRVLENAGHLNYDYSEPVTVATPIPSGQYRVQQPSPVSQLRITYANQERRQQLADESLMMDMLRANKMTPTTLAQLLVPSRHTVEITLTQAPDGVMRSRSRVIDLTPDITQSEAANG